MIVYVMVAWIHEEYELTIGASTCRAHAEELVRAYCNGKYATPRLDAYIGTELVERIVLR